jgi:acetate kinase
MDVEKPLILVANPGSASRKYALYEGTHERAALHFEWLNGRVIYTLYRDNEQHQSGTDLHDLAHACSRVVAIFKEREVLGGHEVISRIGLRIVAPSGYFLQDRLVDEEAVNLLQALKPRAPLHIAATLTELHLLRKEFADTTIIGVSDSAFHATKPDYAWNYGISIEDADRFEIKRFGYHGLSVSAAVRALKRADKLPPKVIVCHLGSGASVTAVHGGKSLDNTMGYSPLEGIVMSTRSGSIDVTAVRALKDVFRFDDDKVEDYLNNHSGLLGLGGSSDTRELLHREAHGDHRAELALQTYVYSVQKAIGQMSAVLGGVDALVFTGTVSERSAPVRERIIARLHYLDFIVNSDVNDAATEPRELIVISRLAHSKPIYVVPTYEAAEIVRRVRRFSP